MTRLLTRRLVAIPVTLLAVSVLVFLATEVLPGDVARTVLGREASDASVADLRRSLGLDEALPVRYAHWLGRFVHGDWGTSYTLKVPVRELVLGRLGNSLLLAAFAFLLLVPIALGLGLLAGLHHDKPTDRVISVVGLALGATPEFVTGVILLVVFAVQLKWFPASAQANPGAGLLVRLDHLVLPAVSLVLLCTGYVARHVRASTVAAVESPYVRAAERPRRAGPVPDRWPGRRRAAVQLPRRGCVAAAVRGRQGSADAAGRRRRTRAALHADHAAGRRDLPAAGSPAATGGRGVTAVQVRPVAVTTDVSLPPTARRRRPIAVVVGGMLVGGWVLVAMFWPYLAPYDPQRQHPTLRFAAPSGAHWLGTDQFGRDTFSRMLAGVRPVLEIAPLATGLALIAGTLIGLLAGTCGRWVDELIMRVLDAVLVFPAIIASILFVAMLGRSVTVLVLVIGLAFVPIVTRSVRAATLVERQQPYVEAALLRG